MLQPTISLPPFPDVPDVPGVPPVARSLIATTPLPVQELADGIGLNNLLTQPLWGLFTTDGLPAFVADSVFAVGYQKDYKISDYPVEQGAFATYNKVALPFTAKVSFLVGSGSLIQNILAAATSTSVVGAINAATGQANRSTFLADLDAAIASLTLYTLVTPEVQYANVNVTHYDYHRTATAGATLMQVDVWVEEVRVTGTAQFSNTQSPNGTSPANGGTAQIVPVTSSQLPVLTTTAVH